jgi:integrase
MPLTNQEIKNANPQSEDIWLPDEKGLRLLIKPNDSRYWRLKYRFHGKQKTLAIGVYPDISLKMARQERDSARCQISKGIDPSEVKKEQKRLSIMDDSNTFSVLAKEWWNHQKGTWKPKHAERVWSRLKNNSFKILDEKPFAKITPPDILKVTKKMELRDSLDIAGRVLQDIRRVFNYAVKMGKLTINPASELTGVIKARKPQHQPSMDNSELGLFLCELTQYHKRGRVLTQLALGLLVRTFVRPGELRGANWDEFDFKNSVWRIPGKRMKMGVEHLVPLSKQVLGLLIKLQEITGPVGFLFPSERNCNDPMSDNTMRRAMHRLGYDGQTDGKSKATPHGFRANASSILNEQSFNPDAIERQLSHMERNGVRAAYTHHARYLVARTEMMQWWSDYLDEKQGEVLGLKAVA